MIPLNLNSRKSLLHYVPSSLVSAFSDDGVTVSWSNPFEERYTGTAEIDQLYRAKVSVLDESFIRNVEDADIGFGQQLDRLRKGDFGFLYDEDNSVRVNLLFLMKRTDRYLFGNMSDAEAFHLVDLAGMCKGSSFHTRLNNAYCIMRSMLLTKEFGSAVTDEMLMLRFDAVLLHAPEGSSFILGASPMNLINPFFSHRHPQYEDGEEYDLAGACFVLPLSPSLSLCLYDSDIYRLKRKNGVAVLSPGDVGILNMIQIYNGGNENGFVYRGDKGSIVDTILRFGGIGVRDIRKKRGENDCYPFDTDLSFLLVKAESEEKFSSLKSNPVDSFVSDSEKYRKGFVERIARDPSSLKKEMHDRYVYACDYLFE